MPQIHRWLPLLLTACHLGDDGSIETEDPTESPTAEGGEDLPIHTGQPDTAGDTGTKAPDEFYEIADIETAYVGPQSLGEFAFYIFVTVYIASEDTCPSKVEVGDGVWRLSGDGCTDSNGTTFGGTMDADFGAADGTTYTFSDWSQHNAAGVNIYYTMDGEMKTLTGGEVRFNGDYEVLRATWSGSVMYQFTDFAYPSVTDLTNAYNGQTSTYTASGQVSVAGMDTFTANLSVTEADSCASEFDAMTLTLTGALETLTYTQSADSCDGCTDWSTEIQQGTICD